MKFSSFSVAVLAGGLLAYAPAFAQTSPNGVPAKSATMTKQHTDGGDAPSDPRANDKATAAWHKQHVDGGDSPSDPRGNDKATAEWHKQHVDGGDSPDNPRAFQKQQAQSLAHPDPGHAIDKQQ